MFRFLEKIGKLHHLEYRDVTMAYCRYGTDYKKPTVFRCFGGWTPKALAKGCVSKNGLFSCGRASHRELGGGRTTSEAAAYPPRLCAEYAAELSKLEHSWSALDRVQLSETGKVRRHIDRGETARSNKEIKEAEDKNCLAGARSAAEVIDNWPEYSKVMRPIATLLETLRASDPELQGLVKCFWVITGEVPTIFGSDFDC